MQEDSLVRPRRTRQRANVQFAQKVDATLTLRRVSCYDLLMVFLQIIPTPTIIVVLPVIVVVWVVVGSVWCSKA